MAAANGQPQDTQQTKKEVTPEQRKLYTQLGVIGALALVAGVMYLPGMFSGNSDQGTSGATATPSVTPAATSATSVSTTDPTGAAGKVTPGTSASSSPATPVTVATGAVVPAARFRPDPFQRVYFIPTPTPLPPPPTPTPRPVVIPPPISIPSPSDDIAPMSPMSPIGLPGVTGNSRQAPQSFNLPPVSINRLDQAARRPTDAFPPRRTLGATAGSVGGVPSVSTDKRLSGVIIGDGVRALLEIQGPQGVMTHVVQPGDEVEGVTVLNIQRFNDGTRTVTRMLIRENGEERTVDLRASPNPTGQGGIGRPPGD